MAETKISKTLDIKMEDILKTTCHSTKVSIQIGGEDFYSYISTDLEKRLLSDIASGKHTDYRLDTDHKLPALIIYYKVYGMTRSLTIDLRRSAPTEASTEASVGTSAVGV